MGLAALPVLSRFRKRVDNRQHNGAALLGLRGVVIKSHGSADAYGFSCALERARNAVTTGLLDRITASIGQMNQSRSLDTQSAAGDNT